MNKPDSWLLDRLRQYNAALLFAFLLVAGLYYARDFLIPFCLAALLAMLILPICKRLENWRLPRALAIILCLLLILLILVSIIVLLSSQIISFAEDIPTLQGQVTRKLESLQKSIEQLTDVPANRQIAFIQQRIGGSLQSAGRYLVSVVATATGALTTLGVVLIYMFFFLLYRDKFVQFALMVVPSRQHESTRQLLSQISLVTQNYLAGVLTVMAILATLNSIGLSIIGIRQPVFFGVLAGMLNIIPYLGSFIGGLIPAIVALLTEDSLTPTLAVVGLFAFTQFLENNFLTPRIVGGKVKVNALATTVALLIGNYIWGIIGMILFIPFMGILKIVFDSVSALRPYGYLIGDEDKPSNPLKASPPSDQTDKTSS